MTSVTGAEQQVAVKPTESGHLLESLWTGPKINNIIKTMIMAPQKCSRCLPGPVMTHWHRRAWFQLLLLLPEPRLHCKPPVCVLEVSPGHVEACSVHDSFTKENWFTKFRKIIAWLIFFFLLWEILSQHVSTYKKKVNIILHLRGFLLGLLSSWNLKVRARWWRLTTQTSLPPRARKSPRPAAVQVGSGSGCSRGPRQVV